MQHYLNKHAFYKHPLIMESAVPDLGLVVVIPAFNESAVTTVLEDLEKCDDPGCSTEVIVVVNHSESAIQEAKQINETTFYKSSAWASQNCTPECQFHILYHPDLPAKKAGVGLARKIGMDEAARRFDSINNQKGVILCLDADCRVPKNYLSEVGKFFAENSKVEGCSINFSHPIDGLTEMHKKAIIDYEHHLRYFIRMQRWVGLPFAYQTIGSAMAVRADVYCKVGGMNTRQAGEDFYFLHKVIARGAFAELNTTTVYPSPRISDRIPFGTGRAMKDLLARGERLTTYDPQSFVDLKVFVDIVPSLYNLESDLWRFLDDKGISRGVRKFLEEQKFAKKLSELKDNTASVQTFVKRFFHWFDAFRLMKYVNFQRDNYYKNVFIEEVGDGHK